MKIRISFIGFFVCGNLVGNEQKVLLYCAGNKDLGIISQKQRRHAFGLHYYCKECLNVQPCLHTTTVVMSWKSSSRPIKNSQLVTPKTVFFDDEVDTDSNNIVKLWDDNSSESGFINAVIESLWNFLTILE